MCRRLMKAWLRGSMPCLPLVATPMGIVAVGADMAYLAQQQKVMVAPVADQNPPGSSVSTTRGAGKPTLPPMEPRDL
jgi:hypothetical protein